MNRLDLQNNIPSVHLTGYAPHPRVARLVPEAIARQNGLVPLDLEGNRLVVACANPRDRQALWDVSNATRMILKPVRAPYPEIRTLLDRIYDYPETPPNIPGAHEIFLRLGFAPVLSAALSTGNNLQTQGAAVDLIHKDASIHSAQVGDFDLRELNLKSLAPDIQTEINGWRLGLPQVRPQNLNPQPNLALLISKEMAQSLSLLPMWWVDGALVVAAPDNYQGEMPKNLPGLPNVPLIPVVCSRYAWERVYRKIYLHGVTAPGMDASATLRWMVKKGHLSELDLTGIRMISQQTGRPAEVIGLENRIFTHEIWMQARAQYFGIALEPLYADSRGGRRDLDGLAALLPEGLARRMEVVPLGRSADVLVLGVVNPDPNIVQLVQTLTGLEVESRLVDDADFEDRLDAVYSKYRQPRLISIPSLDEVLLCMGLVDRKSVV